MAEHDDDQDPKAQESNGGDDLPDDPAELKKLLAQTRSQLGRVTNESKAIKKARAELAESLKGWSKIAEKHGLDPEGLDRKLARAEERDLQRARDSGGEEAQQMIENLRQKHKRERESGSPGDGAAQGAVGGRAGRRPAERGAGEARRHQQAGPQGRSVRLAAAAGEGHAGRRGAAWLQPDGHCRRRRHGAEEYLAQCGRTLTREAQPYLKQSQATGGGATTQRRTAGEAEVPQGYDRQGEERGDRRARAGRLLGAAVGAGA